MKKYRLKTEAVPFFVDKLATAICDMQTWKEYKVDEKALEEVEEARIEYGKNKNDVCKVCDTGRIRTCKDLQRL